MSVNVEKLTEELDTFGLVIDGDSMKEKLVELCITYRLKEGEIVDEWFAFSQTRHVSLTRENLDIFEHEKLSRRPAKACPATKKPHHRAPIQNLNTLEDLVQAEEEEANLLDSYSTPGRVRSSCSL
ncbi:DNA polymerase alpha subunit B-like [Amblyraja radiata]|uniref:DNA polymerase alpha subunit B-like n=1 Tax=Amblyraja radiata TaxID=386614 RepID=UPI0014028298|nr:DNA polymerase alpha subunit B-like [Amblyraja radiata]